MHDLECIRGLDANVTAADSCRPGCSPVRSKNAPAAVLRNSLAVRRRGRAVGGRTDLVREGSMNV